jgi:hypothetical protein
MHICAYDMVVLAEVETPLWQILSTPTWNIYGLLFD